MHEPPAKRYCVPGDSGGWFVHWHYARGPTDIPRKKLNRDPQLFISTVLFVDGHAAKHDFTKVLKDNPDYPYEPTKNWIAFFESMNGSQVNR